MPTTSPDTWVAPSAVLVGDVDVYDRVRATKRVICRSPLPRALIHAQGSELLIFELQSFSASCKAFSDIPPPPLFPAGVDMVRLRPARGPEQH